MSKASVPKANVAVVRRVISEVINKGKLDLVDKLVAKNYVYREATAGTIKGREQYKQLVTLYRTAFPDLRMTIKDALVQGDKVVVRWVSSGTHKGELMGIAPTGRRVTVEGVLISRIVRGQLAVDYECYDALGMLQQIGAVPALGKAQATGA